ncbi:MAG: hypothetical protein ACR2GK_11770 [Gemmatimonadaceae bacterium]
MSLEVFYFGSGNRVVVPIIVKPRSCHGVPSAVPRDPLRQIHVAVRDGA